MGVVNGNYTSTNYVTYYEYTQIVNIQNKYIVAISNCFTVVEIQSKPTFI